MGNEKKCCNHDDNNIHKCGNNCRCNNEKMPLTDEYKLNSTDGKSATCNNWSSVSQNYSIKDSCEKHEKTATNNQWCSCSK